MHNAAPLPEPWGAGVCAVDSERKGCCGVGAWKGETKGGLEFKA